MADRRLPHPWPALMVVVCAALLASPAAADNWKFRADEHARIEVNGDAQTDARLLATDAPGIYLVELPFEWKYVLVDVLSRSAILLMRNEVGRVKSEGQSDVILIDQRSGLATPSYALRSDGQAFEPDPGVRDGASDCDEHSPAGRAAGHGRRRGQRQRGAERRVERRRDQPSGGPAGPGHHDRSQRRLARRRRSRSTGIRRDAVRDLLRNLRRYAVVGVVSPLHALRHR